MYEIKFFRHRKGVQPVKEYLVNLQSQNSKTAKIQANQIATYITLLQERGFSLNKNIIDKVNEKYNIWELRRAVIVSCLSHGSTACSSCSMRFQRKPQKHLSGKLHRLFAKSKILGKGDLMMNNNAIGESWTDVKTELFSPEEIVEIDAAAALMGQLIEARKTQGISQKRLEELSGVSQPVIARMERGTTNPQVNTLLKVLRPLGLTLEIVPSPKSR